MNRMEYFKNKNIIHQRLRKARKARRLSQCDLAAKMQTLNVNMDQQMISKIERNRRIVTDYELICFAKALEIQESWLIGGYEDIIAKDR